MKPSHPFPDFGGQRQRVPLGGENFVTQRSGVKKFETAS
jgi:hypothetical protein